jgi:hypothetical protein
MKTKIAMLMAATFCGWFTAVNLAFAQTWTKTGPGINWSSVTASADGNKMAVAGDNSIYPIFPKQTSQAGVSGIQ